MADSRDPSGVDALGSTMVEARDIHSIDMSQPKNVADLSDKVANCAMFDAA